MANDQAKRQLKKMLRSFTAGSVLHLLGEVVREAADKALRQRDHRRQEQLRLVEATLLVVGMGVDAASPQ